MGVAKETVTRNFADNSCVRPEKTSAGWLKLSAQAHSDLQGHTVIVRHR